ncbi:hypothetical protein [Goodfellowiella coeruleoviolacea]|uniref:Uncharacterized protein n=1 Tax=Goodfellowiella coeruleoviolacea TaxID=334858 RepID=A0AAE3GKA8_9PSEU|nr:hypothetical protein [Goodfellowiella coeruleoviolacea]MCP2168929.1 hypothetical protein [Goodfellowiella coeruleoviolacea]
MSSIDTAARPRPGVLSAAAWSAVLVAVLAVAYAVVTFTAGRDMVRSLATDYLDQEVGELAGSDLFSGEELADIAAAAGYGVLQFTSVVWIVVGIAALLVGLGLLAGRGWVRFVLPLFLLVGLGLALRDLADLTPGVLQGIAAVAALALLVTTVLQWLPASNAHLRQRRTAG